MKVAVLVGFIQDGFVTVIVSSKLAKLVQIGKHDVIFSRYLCSQNFPFAFLQTSTVIC